MKITQVEPILLRGDQAYQSTSQASEATDNGDWQMLVKVSTDQGLVGWSDVETLAPAAVAVIAGQGMGLLGFRTLGQQIVGQNPLDVEAIWERMYVGAAYYGRRGIGMHCLAAIDNCLWSIRAQAAGLPLCRLLGSRRRDSIRAYASTLFRDTPQGMADAARMYIDLGFTAVKFGWGVFGQDPALDDELVAAAREVLGPDRDLMVDPGWYGGGWTIPSRFRSLDENLELCQRMGRYNVTWLEDFIHPERFDEYAAVRAHSPVPIAGGEQVETAWDFRRFISQGCVDVVQPDLTRCGGLTVGREVANLATQANIDIVPHSWLTDRSAQRLQPAADRHAGAGPVRRVQRQPEQADPRDLRRRVQAQQGRNRHHSRRAGAGRAGRRRFHRCPPGGPAGAADLTRVTSHEDT